MRRTWSKTAALLVCASFLASCANIGCVWDCQASQKINLVIGVDER